MSVSYADPKQKNLHKKFPKDHFLSNPQNLDHVFLWNTFFRRNLHRVAIDYLQISLHPYQCLLLYFMGICTFIVVIASRAAAKSFLFAVFVVCKCIVYPNSRIVIVSATIKQAALIVTEKIETELMNSSPILRKEIMKITTNANKIQVKFRNGSTITVTSVRGERSTVLGRDEFRQIKKNDDDTIFSPYQMVRQVPYLKDPYYANVPELLEEPTNVYISSSWREPHWMWKLFDDTFTDMMNGKKSCALGFDESVTLKHNIRTQNQLQQEKRKLDPMSFEIEYLNVRMKENTDAFFPYELIEKNLVLRKPFFPRKDTNIISRQKNSLPKQNGEIRIVAIDLAFVEKKGNDNSVFTCMRALPESITYSGDSRETIVKQGYRRLVPYIESRPGGDISKQAIRIRQLYDDFEADYIVLDTRNGGVICYDLLAKVMYDEERDVEYPPLRCMNDDNIANRIQIAGAKPCIFAVNASEKLNSDIAIDFRSVMENQRIEFLVNIQTALDDILSKIPEHENAADSDTQIFYERPFLETQAFVGETTSLVYERKEQTGAIRISEQGNNCKDRYTSCSYGSYFISLLEQDLLSDSNEYEFNVYIN